MHLKASWNTAMCTNMVSTRAKGSDNLMKLEGKRLVLASGSPRRRDLLGTLGLEIEVHPVAVDETRRQGESPLALVERLAREKAVAAHSQYDGPHPVLAADTIVVDGDQVLGKPIDSDEAQRMLQQLRAKEHQVLTALTVIDPTHGKLYNSVCTTHVPMRNYNQAEIKDYIKTGSPLDKAGAYGIQDRDFNPVDLDHLQGCFANVMGLPLCHLAQCLCQLGWPIQAQMAAEWCRQATGFDCPEIRGSMRDISCLEK
jgi:MAF protein